MRVEARTSGTEYRNADGTTSPGALQIVFCDRGTPKKNQPGFTVYDAIRDELVERGMDPARIRFIHDAERPDDKLALAQACRDGRVSVLLGSTEKMGTGLNVQARCAAIHHVDVPWRPADLEQREGRGIRQGNQNPSIEILTYAAEGSFDTIMWQKVEAKAKFIAQIKSRDLEVREAEDLTGGELGNAAAATKAAATGDPRYVRRVELDDTVKKLTALERAHSEAAARNHFDQKRLAEHIPALSKDIATLDALRPQPERPKQFSFAGTTTSDRTEAASLLGTALRAAYHNGARAGAQHYQTIGHIDDLEVIASRSVVDDAVHVTLGVPSTQRRIPRADLFEGQSISAPISDPTGAKHRGLLSRVENLVRDLPEHRGRLAEQLDTERAALEDLRSTQGAPFEHAEQLSAARTELAEVSMAIAREESSEAARAARAEAEQRLRETGREPGWSLALNPSRQTMAEMGAHSLDAAREAAREEFARRAAEARPSTATTTEHDQAPGKDNTPGKETGKDNDTGKDTGPRPPLGMSGYGQRSPRPAQDNTTGKDNDTGKETSKDTGPRPPLGMSGYGPSTRGRAATLPPQGSPRPPGTGNDRDRDRDNGLGA